MAWATDSRRRAELPPDWDRRRKACIDAAGSQCERTLPSGKRCPRKATDADHAGDRMDHDTLEALCGKHHKDKTQLEAKSARAPKGRRRQPEQHPRRNA